MTRSVDVRAELLNALRLDLVGPRPEHAAHAAYAEEALPIQPSKWYLTGFLVPTSAPLAQRSDDDADEQLDELAAGQGDDDDTPPESSAAPRARMPSSMGLSVIVPAEVDALHAEVRWGDYRPQRQKEVEALPGEAAPGERAGGGRWRRSPQSATKALPLRHGTHAHALEGHPGLTLIVSCRPVGAARDVPPGARSVSVFFVNQRPAAETRRDATYVFQPELTLTSPAPFVPRPDLHGEGHGDWDEQVADLQHHDLVEHVVGHNVSAVAVRDGDGRCREVRSDWMPTAEVEKVAPRVLLDVQLGMEALADAPSAEALQGLLAPLVAEYGAWIEAQAARAPQDRPERAEVARTLLENARRARRRIQAGLDSLADPRRFEAFRLANRAVAVAIRQRRAHERGAEPPGAKPPAWHPFQLAFLLMNVLGADDPLHEDRAVVDLLFFPTGGGKTEAYLGLAAFVMFSRRLKDPSIGSAGLTVLMRYTLRLLTLDQLGRAATLICAMERLRQRDVEALGAWPFEIGLWVGQSATPNHMGRRGDNDPRSARARTIAYQNDSGRKPAPIPLESCPWCGWRFSKESFQLLPNPDTPTDLRVSCVNRQCEFHIRRQPRGLPILTVDEAIYRRLPAFLIATVDKFASLPWVGASAGLFGLVARYDKDGFYGASGESTAGRPLDGPLPPPSLIIQDELHLISGPLGTMVGLYEAAIDALAGGTDGGVGPKIVASTATVRRAERQIQALFGRSAVEIFPPPGPDRRDSFFAVTVSAQDAPPRTYLGVAAQGRNLKVVYLRATLALMAAAQRAWQRYGGAEVAENPADPYMTALSYFSSLRELGGSRRIVEDEVAGRLRDYAARRQRPGIHDNLFADRPRLTEPCELTSRVSTNEVADTKRRLALSHRDKEHVDVALATNMISVGLDITRLGLMVVLGQPKTASEYIQATSRVGRDQTRPGLVVTLLNVYRPRDRSHYERFAAWHDGFYRAVEATSVTPFSPRAIDRGLAGVTVALARLGHPGMTAPKAAANIHAHRQELQFVAETLSRRAERHDLQLDQAEAEALRKKVKDRVTSLLDAWASIATRRGALQYQQEEGGAPPLLFDPLSPELAKQSREAQQFKAGRSLRDVEPVVNLWLRTPEDAPIEEDAP